MRIGCVKEIKNNEFRVGLTPDNVRAYVAAGHEVYVEKGAGAGAGFGDDEYIRAGATLLDGAAEVWRISEMMVKVKLEMLKLLMTLDQFLLFSGMMMQTKNLN